MTQRSHSDSKTADSTHGGEGPAGEKGSALVSAPGLLLIGATGRNSGKTELVCSLIRRFGTDRDVAAAKVTTVSHHGTGCPRGGAGCGVCASLDTPFSVSVETDGPAGKDTVRMLEAGARPVLWLRSRTEALPQAAADFVQRLGDVSIVESNSLRSHVLPDLFLLVRGSDEAELKDSAKAVAHLADMVIASDGQTFSPAPGTITLLHGRWVIRRKATAIILAQSGKNACSEDVGHDNVAQKKAVFKSLVDELNMYVDEVIVCTNQPEDFTSAGVRVIPDNGALCGAQEGVFEAVSHSSNDLNLLVPVESPQVDPDAANWLFRNVDLGNSPIVRRTTQLGGEYIMTRKSSWAGRMKSAVNAAQTTLTTALCFAVLTALLAVGCTDSHQGPASEQRTLRIATTTSVDNTGLMALLTTPFEQRLGVTVQVLAVGSGQALRLARNGDVDMVLTHDPESEREFVQQGHGLTPFLIMHNDFLIVGPPDDPAAVKSAISPAEAMRQIASSTSLFVSRGDKSGTHLKELALWKEAGVTPEGSWYIEAGQGQRLTLEMANQKGAYVLIDRATFEVAKKDIRLQALYENQSTLFNPYSAIVVNPARYPKANTVDAMAFVGWMLSAEGRKIISDFQVEGKTLFIPASSTETDLGTGTRP